MKKTILITLISLAFIGCKKDSARDADLTPTYVGTYNSNLGDTAFVSARDSDMIEIRWAAHSGTTMTFDSVKIASDNTFSDNEFVTFGTIRHSLGTGYFLPTNVMYFKFVLDNNAQIIFNGVKL